MTRPDPAEKIQCLWRTSDDEPCPLGDRTVERRFINVQTTIIVLGIFVHSIVMSIAGYTISEQLRVKPADMLEQVKRVRKDQLREYQNLMTQLTEIREDYPQRLKVILDEIRDRLPEPIE